MIIRFVEQYFRETLERPNCFRIDTIQASNFQIVGEDG